MIHNSHPDTNSENQDLLLPMAHLQLNARAYNGCFAIGCRTIGDVINGLSSGSLSHASLGKKTIEDVGTAVGKFRELSITGGMDWERYGAEQGLAKDYIAMTTANLQRIGQEVRDCPLGMLHLKKACSGLEKVGIKTIGALIDAARAGIGKLENFGAIARMEVVEALPALSRAVQTDGITDWCRYATERGFPLFPEGECDEVPGDVIIGFLTEICKAIIPEQLDDRAWQIFNRRLLVPESNRPTLEAIGSLYGITRERVRQIESECIEAVRRPLFDENYFGLTFRLRPELRKTFSDARNHYESLGLPAWPESRWVGELAALWRVQPETVVRHDRLLTELFGYHRITLERSDLEPLIFSHSTTDKEAKRLARLVEDFHDILLSKNTGFDSFDLAILLKKGRSDFGGLDEVPVLFELCSSAERYGDNHFRLRFDHLKSRMEQGFRVLFDHGSPLHYSEMLREINRRTPNARQLESKENLVNQLSGDERQRPIGKTGLWAIKEWGLETRPLMDVIEDVLKEADEVMQVDAICAKVLEKRPASRASVAMMLEMNPERFMRVGPRVYALKSWDGDLGDEKWWDHDDVAKFVEDFFAARGGRSVDFDELREAFSKATGAGIRSARGILAFHPAVDVDRSDYRKRTARLRDKWRSFKRERASSQGRPLQADRIVEAARAKLIASPSRELQLIQIVKQIEAELGVQRPNVYAAISQSDEIETIAVEGSALKICRLPGRADAVFSQLNAICDPSWKAECERGVAKLTIDDVDIGLFILGRQFDHALRHLLETARDYAGMAVSDDHLKSLGKRIVWAVNHKVFHDEATLNLLKNERNARGHEPSPVEERRAIMKFAPFLAGLYLDYLIIIEQKAGKFRSQGSRMTTLHA